MCTVHTIKMRDSKLREIEYYQNKPFQYNSMQFM